ncbi:MAG: nitroreductase family protein [Patescibacteria group bacterium]|nr:nitroreductase family protein [Patescibacteria group bacterium]
MGTNMIRREAIKKILEAGVQAPSGSNSQPWQFHFEGNDTVAVRMLPELDHPVLNVRAWGTLFATGALLENILIAAAYEGWKISIVLFPKADDRNLVARISFIAEHEANADGGTKELYEAIFKRATNRKPYGMEKIDGVIRERLLAAPSEAGIYDIALKLVDDRGQIETVARAVSVNELVMFRNKRLHELFMQELVWTEAEEHERQSGLYLKTMELKPQQERALKLFRSWKTLNIMNKLVGAARMIASDNAKVYAACSFYGAILCGTEDVDIVHAGQVTERAWLAATAMGLSFHLQTGVNFLAARLETPEGGKIFTVQEAELIRGAYETVRNIFQAGDRFVPVVFRIGRGGEPSARSSRKPPIMV